MKIFYDVNIWKKLEFLNQYRISTYAIYSISRHRKIIAIKTYQQMSFLCLTKNEFFSSHRIFVNYCKNNLHFHNEIASHENSTKHAWSKLSIIVNVKNSKKKISYIGIFLINTYIFQHYYVLSKTLEHNKLSR